MNDLKQNLFDIVKVFSADVGVIHRLNPRDNMLYIVAATDGFPPGFIEHLSVVPVGKGIAGNTALTKKPIVISDLPIDPAKEIKPGARVIGIRGMMSVPIFKKGNSHQVVGTIGIGCQEKREYTQEQVQALMDSATDLAQQLLALNETEQSK